MTVTLSEATVKDLKARPHSDTLPTEGVAPIKGVPSSLEVWIKGLCPPASPNKPTPPNSATPYELMGVKYIQTTTVCVCMCVRVCVFF